MQHWVEERIIPTEKQCRSCKRVLPANQFRRNKRKKDGLDYVCIQCSKKLRLEYSNRWSKEREAQGTEFSLYPTLEKTCSICKRTLPVSSYYMSKGAKDGYKSNCKECDLKRMKIYLEKVKVRPKIVPETKVCSICKQRLPASAFNNSRHRPDGLDIYCKACHNKKQREYLSSPEVRKRMKEWNKAYQQKPEVRTKTRKKARAYAQRPAMRVKRLAYNKKHRALPEVKQQRKQYGKEYYQRKKKIKEQGLKQR
jgi:hypothetical protein